MSNNINNNLKIVHWKNGRYIIINPETGEIMDDANGYGYKDETKASKVLWWKFKGGKDKVESDKLEYKKWLTEDNNQEMIDKIILYMECYFKENITLDEILIDLKNEYNFKLPRKFKKFIFD